MTRKLIFPLLILLTACSSKQTPTPQTQAKQALPVTSIESQESRPAQNAQQEKIESLKRLTSIPLKAARLPAVDVQTLPNGMKLYLLEDHTLPIFQVFGLVQGGSFQEPSDKTGLASMMSTVLRMGGTAHKTPAAINQFLESRAAAIETSSTLEFGTAVARGLSKDFKDVMTLYFEILSEPRFDAEQTELVRRQFIEGLKRILDEPEKIAAREFPKLIYGKDHPRAKTATVSGLEKISRQDLIDFYTKTYHPSRMTLAVVGDFKKDELLALITQQTQSWSQKAASPLGTLPKTPKTPKAGLYGIDKKGGQATIFVGHFGDQRFNPDKFALTLMNFNLGGDIFSSRLGEQIRSNRGLAYGVYSNFGLESDLGMFSVFTQTKSESVGEVIRLIRQEIQKMNAGEGFEESALQFGKDALINEQANAWDPIFGYVRERARLSFYGYPENYLETYPESLKKVSVEDVKRVAKQYLFSDQLTVLIVGDLEKIEPQLKDLGALQRLVVTE